MSIDLRRGEYVGLALERGKPGSWDSQKLATGSVISHAGRFWMAYTGIENVGGYWIPRTGIAVSNDLYHWRKMDGNPTTEPDGIVYGSGSRATNLSHSWRDPFLMRIDDTFYQYICARPADESAAGTVGLASSSDLRQWSFKLPVVAQPFARELEVPQVYQINSLYYLVFCTTADRILPDSKARNPAHCYRSSDYVMVGESPFGPFEMQGTGDIHPEEQETIPYASQLVNWQGEWLLLGTVVCSMLSQPSCDYITDPISLFISDTGLQSIW